jgi:O-methyltransferase
MVRFALREYGLLGSVSRFSAQVTGIRRFIRSPESAADRDARRRLIRCFARIEQNIPCAHAPYQFVLMAAYLLELDVPGDMVQCGAYKGGSTAKLSLLANLSGRRLYVCDSFQGLPDCDESGRIVRGFGRRSDYMFRAGEYSGTLEEVRDNVQRYGCINVCTFVPGWFRDTLPGLNASPAFVFTDVDYVSSARECLTSLWPRLVPGGYWFTHEASLIDYVEGILDVEFWRTTFGCCPPVLMGAGCGLSPAAPSLGMFRK